MKGKTNLAVRAVMFEYDVPQWVLADMLNIGETTLSRAFRYEWTEEAQQTVIDFIKGKTTDVYAVVTAIKTGGGRTSNTRKDGTLYPSQEKAYADRIVSQVERLEAEALLRKNGYL